MNHPEWVIGHLPFACQFLGEVIGILPWLRADWGARFGPVSIPINNPSAYETKEKALAILSDAQSRIAAAVARLDDSRLDELFPDESYRKVFPTIRHALTQVLVGHTANHVGQLNLWRKAAGLRKLTRSFE